jgi:hypothetical protein
VNARASAACTKRLVEREDAWRKTERQLSGLAERLYLRLPTCVITRVARDGSISKLCVSAVTYDTTYSSTSSTGAKDASEKPDK